MRLRGGLESGGATIKKATIKRSTTRVRKLTIAAPSATWRDSIAGGGESYPASMMPLSRARVLTADPYGERNTNPHGTRGEHQHTPRQNVSEEDRIDLLSPAEAERQAEHWPQSGSVVLLRSGRFELA